jgi:HK97 gp10 family phage protein
MLEVKVEGLAELRKALLELPKELHKGPLRSAVIGAAGVVQKQAKANAPRDEGVLQKAIYRTRSKSGSSSVQEMAIVGVRSGKKHKKRGQDAFYWFWLEFGTSKMARKSFLRPAFESTKMQALKVMQDRLAKGIARAAAKVRK